MACCGGKIRINLGSKDGMASFYRTLLFNHNKMSQIANVTVLSRDLFLKKDVLTMLKFAWAVNKAALIKVFKANDIDIEKESDLVDLANLHNTGKDKNGTLKDKKGNPMFFDVVTILASESEATEAQMYAAINEGKLHFV